MQNFHFRFVEGEERLAAAREYWGAADELRRKYFLWDVEPGRKAWGLERLAGLACEMGCWRLEGEPFAMVLAAPTSPGALAAVIHMFFCRGVGGYGELMRRHYFGNTRMKYFLAVIPWTFRAARKFAEGAGFQYLDMMPGACWLADRNRRVNAALYKWSNGRDTRLYDVPF